MSREYRYFTRDEDGLEFIVKSNHGKDNGKYLENALKLDRPINVEIKPSVFNSYKFVNYALTTSEAKALIKELDKMVNYLESREG